MKQQSNFHQIIERFFRQPTKHPYRTVIASAIIGTMLYIGVDIRLAEVVQENKYVLNILSLEQLYEDGPKYIESGKVHINLMEEFREHYEQRKFATILLQVLYPEYSLNKALDNAKKELNIAITSGVEEDAKKGIYGAGLLNHQHYLVAKKFPRSPIGWFKSKDLPDTTSTDIDGELDEFHELVNKLVNTQTLETVKEKCRFACIDSRKIILFLFRVRSSYDNKEKTKSFFNDLERVRDFAKKWAQQVQQDQKEDYKSELEFFSGKARNMDIRSRILKPMLADDMYEVCDILDEAKEEVLAVLAKEM